MSFGFKNIVKEALKDADVDLSKEALARGAVNFIFDDLVPSLVPDLSTEQYVEDDEPSVTMDTYYPSHPYANEKGLVSNSWL